MKIITHAQDAEEDDDIRSAFTAEYLKSSSLISDENGTGGIGGTGGSSGNDGIGGSIGTGK